MRKQKKSILVLGVITVFLAATLLFLSQILPASERFELVLDGKAVLDKKTRLIWERYPDTTKRTWTSGCDYCSNKEVGGLKGWRLPTIEELQRLVDTSQGPPTLPSGHPFSNVQSAYYWSFTPSTYSPGGDWMYCLSFYGGRVSDEHEKVERFYVWCVQAGE